LSEAFPKSGTAERALVSLRRRAQVIRSMRIIVDCRVSSTTPQHDIMKGDHAPMGNSLALLLFMLPLSVDTFAIAAAVGVNRLSGWSRWRISLIFAAFEGGTPLIGLGLGASAGQAVGGVAEYLSGGLLILLGCYLWRSDADHDDDEAAKARRLINARGLTLIALALSISLDELAIGFSFGLGANLAAPITLVAVITVQTLAVSQLGLFLGARISERMRESIERIAGPILIFLGCYPLAEELIRTELVSTRGAAVVSTLVIVLTAVIMYRRFSAPTQTVTVISSDSQRRPVFGTPPGPFNQPRWATSATPRVSLHGNSANDYGPLRHAMEEKVRLDPSTGERHGS
jgi:putative Mn2+ efflux pump MntP